MIKQWCGLSLLLISTVAAAEFCPCPSSFNLIKIGDSLDQVLKTCCAPTARNTHQAEPPVPQKWSYTITPPANPGNAVQGSVEMVVTFDQTQKVTNITVNAQSLTMSNCGNTSVVSYTTNTPNTIHVGDTMAAVKAACAPLTPFIMRAEPLPSNQAAPIVTELQYVGPPPVTLIFENGTLTEIKK